MSHSFLALLRVHTRVDKVLLRQRDTRIFHQFRSKSILRVATLRELPWDRLPDVDGAVTNLQDEEWCARTLKNVLSGSAAGFPTDSNVIFRDAIDL